MMPTIVVPRPSLPQVAGVVGVAFASTIGVLAIAFFVNATRLNCCGHIRNNTKVAIHTVEEALWHYRSDHDDGCPSTLQRLVDEGYLRKTPRDQWGHSLRFVCTGEGDSERANVISAGPDGRFGTEDDIASLWP